VILNDIGRYRELPVWRKDFKSEWKRALNTPITMPLNEKYRPDPKRFVCTCPQFVISRFLLCKHLVQAFHPVPPIFFLEVSRNRTLPFWSHSSLVPLGDPLQSSTPTTAAFIPINDHAVNLATVEDDGEDVHDEDEDDLVDTEADRVWNGRGTFGERMAAHINLIREFCQGLEHQVQFQDHRFLNALERDGAGFLRLAQNCMSRERRRNTRRSSTPTTWERSTGNAMFYRARPVPSEQDT
jgi:hypothetical protein